MEGQGIKVLFFHRLDDGLVLKEGPLPAGGFFIFIGDISEGQEVFLEPLHHEGEAGELGIGIDGIVKTGGGLNNLGEVLGSDSPGRILHDFIQVVIVLGGHPVGGLPEGQEFQGQADFEDLINILGRKDPDPVALVPAVVQEALIIDPLQGDPDGGTGDMEVLG